MRKYLWAFLACALSGALLFASIQIAGPVSPDEARVEVTCDLPVPQRIKNIGSHVDGLGMCVMSSIEMAARWQGLEQLRGLRDWCAQQPGGGYPSKVDRQIKDFCKAKGIEVPGYRQREKVTWAEVQEVVRTGRIACVTYSGHDGVRYRQPIAHMVCSVHVDPQHVAILDNNGIGENELLWMSPQEFDVRFREGDGWLFYWLAPPPPPVPRN